MELLSPTRPPGFCLSVMCLCRFRIGLKLTYEPIIRNRLSDSEPRKEWDKKQHRDDWYVVGRRRYHPKLMPILDRIRCQRDDYYHQSKNCPLVNESSHIFSFTTLACRRISFFVRVDSCDSWIGKS